MKKLLLITLAFIVSVTAFYSCNESLVDDSPGNGPELKSTSLGAKSYIVVLNDDELNSELSKLKGYEKKQEAVRSSSEKILKRAGITDGVVEHVYGNSIHGFSVKIAPGQLKKLQEDPSVKLIEEDQEMTLGEPVVKPFKGKPGGGGGTSPAQQIPWGITRVGGGTNYTGSNVAWIIDTGVDVTHPDLNVDASRGTTFIRRSTPDDDNGHGSHVAGTIAALNNTIGVVGVAAGATVIPVKVLDRNGSGSYSAVIAGVDFVAANGKSGDVANMSLGGPVSDALDAAVLAASEKVKFALAAGNEGDDANNHSPARANGPNVYTISAMNSSDNFASWSNHGNPPIDYCAPGVSILSTWKDGGYNTISGTSMATPHAAGVLLLGAAHKDGNVNGDPDGNADPIIHH